MSNLVSIVMPCYNAERFIEETIQSVINQTYSFWELIIVSDGTTDKLELFKYNKNELLHKKRDPYLLFVGERFGYKNFESFIK